MSTEETIPQKPSFGRRLWQAFKRLLIFLFRALLTLLILGAIGAAIYFGAPVLIDEYLLKDVKVNSERIQEITLEMEDDLQISTQKLNDLQARLETLEIQNDSDKQTISDLQTQLAEAETALQDQGEALGGLDDLRASLDDYTLALASFEDQISVHEADLADARAEFGTLNLSLAAQQNEIEMLQAQFEAQDTTDTLRQELALLKVMELITRTRVSIGDENTGLAKDDLLAAQDLLALLSTQVSVTQSTYLMDIAGRLELAAGNLAQAPGLADKDLEVAWQLLLQGMPAELPAGDASEEATPTPDAGADATPTPTPTPKP
jgi:uncharacterized coiled-coil protein SlyX